MVKCLDEVDRQIVAVLQRDGRTSNVEIARELGLAEGTVRKRYERLVARGVLRMAAVVDPALVECGARTIVGIEVDLAQMERVAVLPRRAARGLCRYAGNRRLQRDCGGGSCFERSPPILFDGQGGHHPRCETHGNVPCVEGCQAAS